MTDSVLQDQIPGVEWTTTSARITDDLTFEQVEEILRRIEILGDAVRWWIGDILKFAEARWGERYAQLLSAARISERQAGRYQRVAALVDENRRRQKLSFSHHEEIAALAPDAQARLLDQAESAGWTVAQLREQRQDIRLLDKLIATPARQEVLPASGVVDAAVGLATVRESLRVNFQHLRGEAPPIRAAQSIAPALRALDQAGETLTRAAKVVDLQNALDRACHHYRQALTEIMAVTHWDIPDIEKIGEIAGRGIRAADQELKEEMMPA